MGNLESTVKVVQGGNGGIETRTSILSLYRNRILFACRISHRLATRISNGIERRIHKGSDVYGPYRTHTHPESVYKGIMESPSLTTSRNLSIPRNHSFSEISTSVLLLPGEI